MSKEKYKENVADPLGNFDELNKTFNIDLTSNNFEKEIEEVKSMKKELQSLEKDLPDVDQIILDNIDRANKLLDKLEEQILNGNISARMVEVCGQLINAVTNAATSITGINYNQQVIDNKNRALDIKEKEIAVKIATGQIKGAKEVNITNNNLVMNREQLLKMMEE